jgi:cysteine desulfurase
MKRTVYLDNAATTPLDPRVAEAMLPWLTTNFGNASSPHHLGRHSHVAVEEAREKIAAIIGAQPAEIIFTSGGTESNNAVINGVRLSGGARTHIVSSAAEHHAVLHPVQAGMHFGWESSILNPGADGTVSADRVAESLNDRTVLVSLMHVNNETGSVNDIGTLAKVCHDRGVLFHTDAVQAVGKIPVDVTESGVDFLSMSSHKFYGPKGIGALYVRSGSTWSPWMLGGSQERNRRGGTLNVPGIVGMAKALELAANEMKTTSERVTGLKNQLTHGLIDLFGDTIRFNNPADGICTIVNCSFTLDGGAALDGEMLLLNLDIEGICCSNGSACTSGAIEPSHVLLALGVPFETARASLRLSLGKFTTEEDIHHTVKTVGTIVNRMSRKSKPVL